MVQLLDEIVVVDVEATCWEGGPPPGQVQEIIEIGVCRLDAATLERRGKESLLVRPARSEVSPFCTALTTLTPEQVAGGLGFAEACARLEARHRTRDRLWASWGVFDRIIFDEQCARDGVPSPFGPTHLDVKSLLALARGGRRETPMMDALAQLGIAHEGTHHRGDDDAWNVAALLAALLRAARPGLAAAATP